MATPRIPMTAWQAANLPSELPLHIRRNIGPGEDGCWLWTRSRSRDGYGWASYQNRTYQAHRLVYLLLVGEPGDGLHLDHLCRVRHCVNPGHLDPVTPAENLRRSELIPAGMTRCAKGHSFTDYSGQRRCLICKQAYQRNYDKTRRAS